MRNVNFEAVEIIRRTEVDQHFAVGIIGQDFYIFGIGQVHFAEIFGIISAVGLEFADQFVVNFHPRRARGERLGSVHAYDYRERIFFLAGKLDERAAGVGELNFGADADEGHRSALLNLNPDAVGGKAHHAGGFDPGNLLQFFLAVVERYKEDIAADVAAHHFHDLATSDVAQAGHFNVIARIQAEAPVVLAVEVERARGESAGGHNDDGQ